VLKRSPRRDDGEQQKPFAGRKMLKRGAGAEAGEGEDDAGHPAGKKSRADGPAVGSAAFLGGGGGPHKSESELNEAESTAIQALQGAAAMRSQGRGRPNRRNNYHGVAGASGGAGYKAFWGRQVARAREETLATAVTGFGAAPGPEQPRTLASILEGAKVWDGAGYPAHHSAASILRGVAAGPAAGGGADAAALAAAHSPAQGSAARQSQFVGRPTLARGAGGLAKASSGASALLQASAALGSDAPAAAEAGGAAQHSAPDAEAGAAGGLAPPGAADAPALPGAAEALPPPPSLPY